MRSSLLALQFVALLALAPAGEATVLTFDVPGDDWDLLPHQYGDFVSAESDGVGHYLMGNGWTPDIYASYRQDRALDYTFEYLTMWKSDQTGDLHDTVFANPDGSLGWVKLSSVACGVEVVLNGFDMAGYPDTDIEDQLVRVLDGITLVQLWPEPGEPITYTIPGSGHEHFAPMVDGQPVQAKSLIIEFGHDHDAVLDNVNFDQVDVWTAPPSPPPPPGAPPPEGPTCTFTPEISLTALNESEIETPIPTNAIWIENQNNYSENFYRVLSRICG